MTEKDVKDEPDEELDDDLDEDDEPDEFTPPKTKAELDALIKSAGNTEAKKWRMRAMGRDPKWTRPVSKDQPDDDKKPSGQGGKSEAEIEADVRRKIQAEFDERAKDTNLRASVATALMTAGLNISEDEAKDPDKARRAVNKVVGMIELKNLSLEDDGSIAGLSDELAELRATYPGMFRQGGNGSGRGKPGGDSAARRGGSGGKRDPLEEMAESFHRR